MPKEIPKPPEGDPPWLTTFGDLITLLMTFFVLLISFSTINTDKLMSVVEKLQGEIGLLDKINETGALDGGSGTSEPIPADVAALLEKGMSDKAVLTAMKKLIKQVAEQMQRSELNQHMDMQLYNEELVMRIEADKIFKHNVAEFKEENLGMIDSLFSVFNGVPNDMIISTRVDTSFIPSKEYLSRFELSIARAINLCKYFVKEGNLKPGRIGVSERGKLYKPAESSKINSKLDYIEIILLSSNAALRHSA